MPRFGIWESRMNAHWLRVSEEKLNVSSKVQCCLQPCYIWHENTGFSRTVCFTEVLSQLVCSTEGNVERAWQMLLPQHHIHPKLAEGVQGNIALYVNQWVNRNIWVNLAGIQWPAEGCTMGFIKQHGRKLNAIHVKYTCTVYFVQCLSSNTDLVKCLNCS